MAIIASTPDSNYNYWRRAANVLLLSFVAYGLALGGIAEMDAWTGAIGTNILSLLNFPGIVVFFFMQDILGPYGPQPTIILPTVGAWSLIGFVIYVIVRFKAALLLKPD